MNWLLHALIICQYDQSDRYQLRADTRGEMVLPTYMTRLFESRSFYSSAPTVWNFLLINIRDLSLTFKQFKQRLKTYLFSIKIKTSISCVTQTKVS
jgi:hypothetical protein